MWCPICGYEKTIIVGTVTSSLVERFRKCPDCKYTFVTIEHVKNDLRWGESEIKSREEVVLLVKNKYPQKDLFEK
jgi:transcriptional repressor NrdR